MTAKYFAPIFDILDCLSIVPVILNSVQLIDSTLWSNLLLILLTYEFCNMIFEILLNFLNSIINLCNSFVHPFDDGIFSMLYLLLHLVNFTTPLLVFSFTIFIVFIFGYSWLNDIEVTIFIISLFWIVQL